MGKPVPTAKDINEAHRLARSSAETAVQHAIRCGQLLAAKKAEIGRGDFDLWVAKNCDFGRSSAYAYLKVATKSSRGLDDLRSIQQALGYDKPKAKPVTPEPQVMNPPESAAQGSEAGNPQKAHVMGIGAVPRAAEARPAEAAPPSITPPPEFDFEGYEPEDDEAFKANIENALMADDRNAALVEELKQVHRELQAVKSSRDHYMSQAGEAVRLVKARDREIERLKRELAKARAEIESLKEAV
jgi:hypothetical protein